MSSANRRQGIVIFDYGSQYTLLIARRCRELGVFSEVLDPKRHQDLDRDFDVKGVILSGGPDSVSDPGARAWPEALASYPGPILGICYGMQLMVHSRGGTLRSGQGREYGKAEICWQQQNPHPFWRGLPAALKVWMSHGDDITDAGPEFLPLAYSRDGVLAAVAHRQRPWVGLQFHPEVAHSESGEVMLQNFLVDICGCARDWRPQEMVDLLSTQVRNQVEARKVLMAVSGGVDSTVAAALLSHALSKEQVLPVLIDTGLLRFQEAALVKESLSKVGFDHLVVLDRKEVFMNALAGVSDPEEKRRIIGRCFVREFEKVARQHSEVDFLGQGTLYPDVIESAGDGAGAKVIKTHHNVGGLPKDLALDLVEPFRWLFKDEVRQVGRHLGLPSKLIDRHPFPGPGLAVRLPGAITSDRVEILQKADHIFIEALHEFDLYKDVWQAFAVLLPVQTVGVMGDNRSYEWACSLRAVVSTDAMTAHVAELPYSFLTTVSDRIVRQVAGINRVLFDITSKPPATIEWE